MTDRGSALIETLVLGFVAVMLVLQAAIAAARIQTAGEEATEVAQIAATWAARHGSHDGAEQLALDLLPDATVEVKGGPDRIRVTVVTEVALVGPSGSPLAREVVGRASVRISPYRSGNG